VAIRSFQHKGLERFFEHGTKAGIRPEHADRLRLILARLAVAAAPRDMKLPGLDLHPLHHGRRGEWAVSVSGNWRVTFRFDDGSVIEVNYEDYH
jgi:toxin HigB-1